VIWDGNNPCPADMPNPFHAHIMIITGNSREKLNEMIKCYNFDQLVIDPSVPPWHLNSWIEALQNASIPFFDVRNQGAFVWDVSKSMN
jgi:hypothetical protein